MGEPLYSVGTWNTNVQGFTRQRGLSVPSINVPLRTLRAALKELRECGYQADRQRYMGDDGEWEWASDPMVLVERTDGLNYRKILKQWRR